MPEVRLITPHHKAEHEEDAGCSLLPSVFQLR